MTKWSLNRGGLLDTGCHKIVSPAIGLSQHNYGAHTHRFSNCTPPLHPWIKDSAPAMALFKFFQPCQGTSEWLLWSQFPRYETISHSHLAISASSLPPFSASLHLSLPSSLPPFSASLLASYLNFFSVGLGTRLPLLHAQQG